jgi:hypothetical protein
MTKLNKMLALALVLQLVVLVAVSFAKSDQRVLQIGKVFEGFEPDKVTKIEVTGTAGTAQDKKQKSVILEKQGTNWGIATADAYPVDQTKVQEFLKNVEKLKTTGPVVSKEGYFKKLEVADDEFQRKIVLTHDGKQIAFFLGTSPGFKRVHLRRADSKDVVLVEGLTAWEAGFKASDWADRNYFKVPETDVWAVTLQNAKGTIQMEKSPSGEWAVLGLKPNQKLQKSSVDDLVRKVSSVSLEEPIGKAAKPESGLDKPLATVTLVTGTSTVAGQPPPSTKTQVLKIGAKASEGNAYYVSSSASEWVVTAPGWAVEPLTTKASTDLLEAEKKPAK